MMKRVLLALIRTYQVTISVFLGPRCRFYPSCSAYSSEAIEIHGVVKGLGMTVARVSKCHPFHPGGFDPVPTEQPLSTVEKGI
jgi:uncharacterized protein